MSSESQTPENSPQIDFPDHFDHLTQEQELYKKWESVGAFSFEKAEDSKAPVFNIAMPPPNANGELHLGHSLGYTVMDILGRYHRLTGHRTLLLPGKDHAGIQTQVVFEKLLKAQGVDHHAMSSEELYDKCYEFCIDRAAYMRSQEKWLGLSADWDKELFTLDPQLSEIVFETFKRMWDDGLVYRKKRIVNWSVFSQTALSDVEVEFKEVPGHLWFIRYPWTTKPSSAREVAAFELSPTHKALKGDNHSFVVIAPKGTALPVNGTRVILPEGEYLAFKKIEDFKKLAEQTGEQLHHTTHEAMIVLPAVESETGMVVATTRPETLLGDVALAVHPEDPRYAAFVGSSVQLPRTARSIPVIADNAIDPTYGTGVVKVTPAHDPLDYEIGERHKLEAIQVIGKDGRMTQEAGAAYVGLKGSECREKVVADVENDGLLIKTEEMSHKVPISERGKDVIEPLLSEQWWIAVDKPGNSLKQRALQFIKESRINVFPDRFTELFVQWLENLRDWNISRQIWWGHRMPIWYKTNSDGSTETQVSLSDLSADGWTQETDTFDTWFSSGQWAYSTFARHGLTDLDKKPLGDFVPSHTMVMGRDILLFWACRMLLLTTYRINEVPWKNILFTGLIRDEHGQKMSKSKGNGIEPGDIIRKYGADAVRLGLVISSSAGNDISLSIKKIEGYSKFINKIWNAARLLVLKTSDEAQPLVRFPDMLTLESSRWIINELAKARIAASERMKVYDVSAAAHELYNFTWGVFCDWYLEICKVLCEKGTESEKSEAKLVARACFRELLLLLHPLIPFVTEDLYQRLPGCARKPTLCQETLETLPGVTYEGAGISMMQEVITSIRSVKAYMNAQYARIRVALQVDLSDELKLLIAEIAKVDLVAVSDIPSDMALRKPILGGSIVCEVAGKDTYKARLEKELVQAKATRETLTKKLSGPFASHGKPELVAAEREKLRDVEQLAVQLEQEIQQLK